MTLERLVTLDFKPSITILGESHVETKETICSDLCQVDHFANQIFGGKSVSHKICWDET